MLEAFAQGFWGCFDPTVFGFLLVGVIIGLVIGIAPGIGSLVGCALVMGLVGRFPPAVGISLMVGIFSTTPTGGPITAIVLNIPGTASSLATCLDGFPMNQRGEGGRAIGAAIGSSMLGGIASTLMALAMIPILVPIVMLFRTADMFMTVLWALSFIALLGGGSPTKGIISGCLGLLLSFVGLYSPTGEIRYTFGSSMIYNGFSIVTLALGLFALPPLFETIMQGKTAIVQTKTSGTMRGVMQGLKDIYIYR